MTYQFAPVQTQAYAPVLNQASYVPNAPAALAQPKPLNEKQIVFTIVNSELAKFKRAGQQVDAKAIKALYQQHYTGWSCSQLMLAALNLVQIYDQNTKQWRLVANEAELKSKQVQFSKRFSYWKSRSVA